MNSLLSQQQIEQKIYLIRGRKVMLDSDLAKLYGVPVKRLNEAVKRNLKRFPSDFMHLLTSREFKVLRSQIATLDIPGRGRYSKYLPFVFTEQGVAMLSSVLHSERAIEVNIAIMRAFVNLREMIYLNKELAHKLEQLERKIEKHDGEIRTIFEAIRQLMMPPEKPKRKIGFHTES